MRTAQNCEQRGAQRTSPAAAGLLPEQRPAGVPRGHAGLDGAAPECSHHRDAILAVTHDVVLTDPDQLDRWQRFAAQFGPRDPNAARAHVLSQRIEAGVEVGTRARSCRRMRATRPSRWC